MNEKFSDSKKYCGFILLLLLLALLRFFDNDYKNNSVTDIDETDVFVEIEGDISRPGVYSFQENPDLKQLITLGGGLKNKSINSAVIDDFFLESGEKITIHMDTGEPEIAVQEMTAFRKFTLGIPISINGESEEGLTSLPGIGPAMAKAIVDERKKRGGFNKTIELLDVHGMGEKKYSKIVPYITE